MAKHMNFTGLFVSAVLAWLPVSAQCGGPSYLDELGKMDAQLAVLRKQIELRDARQSLAGGVSTLPVVSSVSGFDGDLTATLKYANGRKVNVKRGQQLSGGMLVREVSRQGVVVRVASVDAPLEFDSGSGREGAVAAGQDKTPPHLLPPIPQVNVPLPGALMTPPATDQAQPPAAKAATQPGADPKGK